MLSVFNPVFLALSCATISSQTQVQPKVTDKKVSTMTTHASGTFSVKLVPQKDDTISSAGIGRMSIDKQFHGDLEASSQGQMLAAGTEVKDSAGYVALEKVSGALQGRKGTFVLQHSGTMTRGLGQLMVTVVPDSGTGELKGLTGKMTIDIRDGQHFYGFDYSLAPAP
jgi:hypothetical protein